MKLEFAKRSTKIFIGVLLFIALCINLYFGEHSPLRRSQWAASAPNDASTDDPAAAARIASEEHARFLARYVNSGFSRKSDVNLVAVVATSETRKIDRDISQALARRLKAGNAEIVGTFFKPELVADGFLDQLLAESTQLRERLELDKTLDGLILARLRVEYVDNPSLQNVITASMSLDVAVQALRSGSNSKTWTLSASGAGFDRNAARAMAEERILKAISADTNMSLAFDNWNRRLALRRFPLVSISQPEPCS